MPLPEIICPDCNRVAIDSGTWVKPDKAAGVLVEGLDPANCAGCREALAKRGYAVVAITTNDDGTATIIPA